MTVADLLANTTSWELTYWSQLYSIESHERARQR